MSDTAEPRSMLKAAEPLTVTGPGAGRAPATWGQEYMWEILDILGHGGAALNSRNGVRIPDGMPRDEVLRRVATVFGRHESLRTRFEGDALGSVTQVVDPHQSLPVHVLDAADSSPAAALGRLGTLLAEAWFDVRHEPLARIGIVERAGQPESVVLTTSHMSIDAWSGFLLRTELGELLTGVPPSGGAAAQPVRQAQWERSAEGQRHNAKAMRYWERTLAGFPLKLPGDGEGPADSPRYNHGVLTSPAGFAAARRIAGWAGVTLPTVLLGALAFVLSRACGLSECPLLVRTGNRSRPEHRWTIGHFSQVTPMLVDTDQANAGTYLHQVRRTSYGALWYGLYAPVDMALLRTRLSAERGCPIPLRMTLNYVPVWEPGATPSDDTTETSESTFEWIGGADTENIAAYCNVWEGRNSFSLYTDSTFLPAARVEHTLRQMESFLRQVDSGVTDLERVSL